MIHPMTRRVKWDGGEFRLALFSDMHLGSDDIDLQKMQEDFDTVAKENRRILINGDLVEAILPTDLKRYTASKSIGLRDDLLNQITDIALHFLEPYVDFIDLIGTGNHEQAPIKHNHYDIVGALVYLLNQKRSKSLPLIHRAGYQGFAQYIIEHNAGHGSAFTIYHHHGIGGSAPVTKGMIDINRIVYSHDADLWWIGHKHVGTHDPYIVRDGLNHRGEYRRKVGQAIFTPGYKKAVNIDSGGYKLHYSDQFYNMQASGYAVVNIHRDSYNKSIKNFEVISR